MFFYFQSEYLHSSGYMGYNEICMLQNTKEWETRWDENSSTSFLIKGNKVVSFDGPQGVKEKVDIIFLINQLLVINLILFLQFLGFVCRKKESGRRFFPQIRSRRFSSKLRNLQIKISVAKYRQRRIPQDQNREQSGGL